jgi:hypothetical protein
MPQKATSTKSPTIKAAVIARYVEGRPKARIARELEIDRETVTRILDEPGIKEAVEASRTRCLALLPKAERAVERQLDEGDGDLGLRLLEKSGVLIAGEVQPPRFDPSVNVAVALLSAPVATHSLGEGAPTAEASAGAPSRPNAAVCEVGLGNQE